MHGNEMRRVLADEIYKLRSGRAKPDRVNAIARAASQITSSIRVELQYCAMTGQTPHIPFVGVVGKALSKPHEDRKTRAIKGPR